MSFPWGAFKPMGYEVEQRMGYNVPPPPSPFRVKAREVYKALRDYRDLLNEEELSLLDEIQELAGWPRSPAPPRGDSNAPITLTDTQLRKLRDAAFEEGRKSVQSNAP